MLGGGGFSFGAATSTAPPAFGAASSAPSGFGATSSAQPLFGTASTVPAFGAATSTPSLFGATSTPSTSLFGSTAPPAAGTMGFAFGSTPTASTAGVSSAPSLFGGTTTTSFGASAAPTGTTFGFGTTPASSAAPSFGLGGTTQTPGVGLFGAQSAPAAPASVPSVGLGGTSLNISGQGAAKSKQDSASAAKENRVDNEIMVTVNAFRQHVKNQKLMREEIARASEKPIEKIGDETSEMMKILSAINAGIARNMTIANKLKVEVAKELRNAEMAQRTQDTPQGLQMENTAPVEFFFNLLEEFERKIHAFRQQIDEAARNLQSVHQLGAMSTRDLVDAVKKLHESFVALASRLYSIHQQVQGLREGSGGHPRVGLRDFTNQTTRNLTAGAASPLPNRQSIGLMGPSPFSGAVRSANKAPLDRTGLSGSIAGPPTVGLGQTLGSPFQLGGFGSGSTNVSGFGNPNASSLQSSFTLNSPPGTKRGKR